MSSNDNNADHFNIQGNALVENGQYSEAISEYRRAITLNSKNPSYHNRLGNAYYSDEQYSEAILEYRQAITLNSENPVYYDNLGNAYYLNKQYSEAISEYRQAITLNSKNPSYHNRLGNAYYANKQYSEAILEYGQAITLNSKNSVYYDNLGDAYYVNEQYSEAISEYRQAITLDSKNPHYYYNCAVVCGMIGETKKAVEICNEGMKLSEKDPVLWLIRGILYCKSKKLSLARKDIIRGLAMRILVTKKLNSSIANEIDESSINSIEKTVEKYVDEMENGNIPESDLFEQLDMNSIAALNFFEERTKNYFAKACICNYRLQREPFNEDDILNEKIQYIKKWRENWRNQNEKDAVEIDNKTLELLLTSGENKIHNFFVKTANDEHKSNAVSFLIQLLENSYSFLNASLREANKELGETLYQYTSASTLGKICSLSDPENESKFALRLYNASYMNDPEEGHLLLKNFFENNKEPKDSIIDYEEWASPTTVSDVYISSLTNSNPVYDANTSSKSMPLWNSYADNHTGVALGITVKIPLQKPTRNVAKSNQLDGIDMEKQSPDTFPIHHNLYKVFYKKDNYDGNNASESVNDNKSNMQETIDNIESSYENICNLSDIFKDIELVKTCIYTALEKIRYLYKESYYEYESEYRIIRETNVESAQYEKGNPRLFVTLDKSTVNASLKEIIFGSKFEGAYLWTPLISKKLGKGVKCRKSNLAYR